MPAVDDYLESQILTASPHRLHLLVVDGAIRFARLGQAAMREQRWEAMGEALGRARNCLTEMIGGLNPDASPELADQLKSLFAFIYRCVSLAELEPNPQRIDDAVRLLQIHRETWVELGLKLQREQTGGAAAMIPAPHRRSWST